MTIKQKIKALQSSDSFAGKLLYKYVQKVAHMVRLLLKSEYRSRYVTQWKFGNHQYQQEVFTAPDRYPLLFSQCQVYFKDMPKPNVISFGCSTGDEVASINKYLPNATIMGIDINKWCIRQCKKKFRNPLFSFHHSLSKEFAAADNFDAIFCMAVFQRSENRTNTDNSVATGFKFNQFEREVSDLDGKLKPGGLFIIDQTDFRFTDTSVGKNYKPLDFEGNKKFNQRPTFDKYNRKISDVSEEYRMFVKL